MEKDNTPRIRNNLKDLIISTNNNLETAIKDLKKVDVKFIGTEEVLHLELENDVTVKVGRIEELLKYKINHKITLYDAAYDKIRGSYEALKLIDLLYNNDIIFSFALKYYPDLELVREWVKLHEEIKVFDDIQL